METFVGDTVNISLGTGVDLTTATVLLIKYRKPDDSVGSWVPILDGSEAVQFNTITSTLDQRGTWTLQAYAEFGAARLHGKWVEMKVFAPIYD